MAEPQEFVDEESQKRLEYLRRLVIKLRSAVRLGELTEQDALVLFNETANLVMLQAKRRFAWEKLPKYQYSFETLQAKEKLPYAEEIIGVEGQEFDWEPYEQELLSSIETGRPPGLLLEEKATWEKEQIKTQADKEYINKLLPYLNSLTAQNTQDAKKGIPEEERRGITETQKQQILSNTQRRLSVGLTPKDLPESANVEAYQKNLSDYMGQVEMSNAVIAQSRLSTEDKIKMQLTTDRALASSFGGEPTTDWANMYEQWRRQTLGEVTGPRDWIDRWILQNTPNPYERSSEQERLQYISRLQQDVEKYGDLAKQPNLYEPGTTAYQLQSMYPQAYQFAQEELGRQLEAAPTGRGYIAAPRPTTPPTPEWLTGFVPGLKAGEPIRKEWTPTPSAQQWTQAAPSTKEQFAGYLDWAEMPYEDVLGRMQQMLPESPRAGYGWAPARQRTR